MKEDIRSIKEDIKELKPLVAKVNNLYTVVTNLDIRMNKKFRYVNVKIAVSTIILILIIIWFILYQMHMNTSFVKERDLETNNKIFHINARARNTD